MNLKNRFIQDIMVYSYITHKKGAHHKIDDVILKLFVDGMGRIDGKIFSDIIFCLADCSFQWNYTAIIFARQNIYVYYALSKLLSSN